MASHHPRLAESSQVTREHHSSPLTESEVALNIAARREELHRNTPGAVTLSAACVFEFHEAISGSLTTALRSRSGSYAREQGTGHRALTFEDICELVIAGGSEGRTAVRALLGPVLTLLDGAGSGVTVLDAAADFLHEACKSGTEISKEIREAKEALRRLEMAEATRARISAPLADAIGLVKSGGVA